MPLPPLAYLMKELGLKTSDWTGLSMKDREDLKAWADEEQKTLGV